MAGCLPSFKHIFAPNKQRPRLPGDVRRSNSRASLAEQPRGRRRGSQPHSRHGSTSSTTRRSSASRRSSSDQRPRRRSRSRSHSRARSASPVQPRDGNPSKISPESRPTGLFNGVRPQVSDSVSLRQQALEAEQRLPRMVSAKDLKGMGFERVRHQPLRVVEPVSREAPRVVRLQPADREVSGQQMLQQPAQQPFQKPVQKPFQQPLQQLAQQPIPLQQAKPVLVRSRKSSREQLPSQSRSLERPTGLRPAPKSAPSSVLPTQQTTQTTQTAQITQTTQAFPVELPGEFTDVMEKEAVHIGPALRQVASYDTLDRSLRLTTPVSRMSTAQSSGLSTLTAVAELAGHGIPPSPIDSFGFTAELPGSGPALVEKDAGPVPPMELPATIPYSQDLTKRMANAMLSASR